MGLDLLKRKKLTKETWRKKGNGKEWKIKKTKIN